DRATSRPIGPATPYDENAVTNRITDGRGLRIGEQTAWITRLRNGSPCTGQASLTELWWTAPPRKATVRGAGPRSPRATSATAVQVRVKASWNAAQCSRAKLCRSLSPAF